MTLQVNSTAVNEVYLNNNVGYTVVGNPTITDGIVSGFSAGNMSNASVLTLPQVFDLTKPFHISLKFTPSAKSFKCLLGKYSSTNGGILVNGVYDTTFNFRLYNGSDATINTNFSYDSDIIIGNAHLFDLIYDGVESYKFSIKNLVTNTTVLNQTITSSQQGSTTAGFTIGATKLDMFYTAFNGSIDLNNTYIKTNGITWFNGKETASSTVNEVYYNKNCGYTIEGSPTIVNGIVSGFSNNDYLSLPANLSYGASNAFEWNIKFTTPTEFTTSWLLNITTSSINCGIYYATNKNIFIPIASGSAYGEITSTGMQENTTYIVNVVKQSDGNVISTLKDANGQVIKQQTKNIGEVSLSYSTHKLGTSASLAFSGSIDLNNTYIKVNGVTWFNGKDVNFQNKNNYRIENGNLVWANPNLWLESSGTQYIDTGYTPIQYDEIKTDIMFTSSNFSIVRTIFSAGTENYQLVFGPYDKKTYFKYFAQGNASVINFLPNINTWYSLNINENGVCSFGGYTTTSTYTSALDGDNTTMYLFMRRNNIYPFIGKLKSFIIKNKGIIKKHFVPVPKGLVIGNYTVPSNGMWDIVTQTFFANQGTGNFTFGKDGNTPVWTRSV